MRIARCGTTIRQVCSSIHVACFFGAAASEAEAVLRENFVAKVERVGDDRQAGGPHEDAEADSRVELAEDFDAEDPLIWVAVLVRQPAMNFVHEVGRHFVELASLEADRRDVCKTDTLLPI